MFTTILLIFVSFFSNSHAFSLTSTISLNPQQKCHHYRSIMLEMKDENKEVNKFYLPKSNFDNLKHSKNMFSRSIVSTLAIALGGAVILPKTTIADDIAVITESKPVVNLGDLKLPYNHENLKLQQFLGPSATIIFNMKIDDPQTVSQFPSLVELYKKYMDKGLNVLAFPTEQGWFEPDDDETCRLKAETYYGFGDYPKAVVFDKIDILGPSAHPLYKEITKALPTPNGYSRITLNYEKFLLDGTGTPVRRYPRKYSPYDMEADIVALLNGDLLPPVSPQYIKMWREAKREVIKSEYSFRFNYNYYDAPESMYKYDTAKDKV